MAAIPTNPYATGNRVYQGSRVSPNIGPVRDKSGYNERDIRRQAQQQALIDRYQRYTGQIKN